MPAPEENPRQSEDVDSVVSSFLAELDAIRVELHPGREPSPPVLAKPAPAPAAAPKVRLDRLRLTSVAVIFILAVLLVLSGWIYFRDAENTAARPAEIFPAAKAPGASGASHPNLHDTALLLAGRPVPASSPLFRISRSKIMQQHRKEMQAFWKQVQGGNLAAIHRWQNENIPDRLKHQPVLYPMSGADYLNAQAFFPRAGEYLLLSLEPPGEIPDIRRLEEQEMENSMAAIRFTVRSIAWVNYLQSKPMREELTNSAFRGVLPLIVLFAAGVGHTIQDVRSVTIGPDGTLVADNNPDPPGRFRRVAGVQVPDDGIRGVRIDFVDQGDRTSKSITYLQMELRDRIFELETPESRFLASLRNRNSMLKSAVYLLHGAGYSRVSDFIRGSSDLVIQDDSGIPFNHFRSSSWQEHLFGSYTRPEPLGTLTNPPKQPVLAERYTLGSRPLSFLYGYGGLWGK